MGVLRGDAQGHLAFLSPIPTPGILPLIWYQQPGFPLGIYPAILWGLVSQRQAQGPKQFTGLSLGTFLCSPPWGCWASFVSLGERSGLRMKLQ